MSNLVNKKVLIIALIFGLITFLISIVYLGNVSSNQKYKNESVKIIVAKTNIPPRSIISKELISFRNIPRQYLVEGAAQKPEEVLDKVTTTQLLAGEQISVLKLLQRGTKLGLSFIVPKNKRAVSVEVDASASIAGLIKPGDMVDILCTFESADVERTVTILQNVPVLAIDQEIIGNIKDTNKINRSVIATFALNLEESEKLVFASSKGRLKLLLRPIDDPEILKSYGATVYQLLPYRPVETKNYSGSYIRIFRGTKANSQRI